MSISKLKGPAATGETVTSKVVLPETRIVPEGTTVSVAVQFTSLLNRIAPMLRARLPVLSMR